MKRKRTRYTSNEGKTDAQIMLDILREIGVNQCDLLDTLNATLSQYEYRIQTTAMPLIPVIIKNDGYVTGRIIKQSEFDMVKAVNDHLVSAFDLVSHFAH